MTRADRDFSYMGWVKHQACALSPDGLRAAGLVDRPGAPRWSSAVEAAGPCSGGSFVEADHAGLERGLSQKAPDETCIPMCTGHHAARTTSTGYFALLTPDERVAWRLQTIVRHQVAYSRWRAAMDAGWF